MLFHYCQFLKKNKEKWSGYKSPYHYIANYKYNKVIYVRDFFIGLHERLNYDKLFVKKITDNYNLFCQKLIERIEEMCDSFFGMNKCIDDNEEW